MGRLGFSRRILSVALLAIAAAGCRGSAPPPDWFSKPEQGTGRFLYFVGSTAAAPDESSARELAAQKALYELSVYCGAQLTTDFSSVEVEKNGELNQEVSLTVDVSGEEITIQEASTDKWVVQPNEKTGFDAYVRIKWPRAQYRVVLAAKQAKATRALSLFLEAERAAEDLRMSDARRFLRETRQALGPLRGQLPLDHPTYTNSGLVFDGAEALATRLQDIEARRSRVMAVSVVCAENGSPRACASRWVGSIRERIAQLGFEIATQPVTDLTATAILDSKAPTTDASLRESRYVFAVKYDANNSGQEDGFAFARCGVRGVVFDTDQNEILHITEVKPQKGGHVHFAGAIIKGCEKAETELMAWIDQSVSSLKKESRK